MERNCKHDEQAPCQPLECLVSQQLLTLTSRRVKLAQGEHGSSNPAVDAEILKISNALRSCALEKARALGVNEDSD